MSQTVKAQIVDEKIGIVKRAEPYKCDILLVSRILLHKENHTFFKRMQILMFDTH